MSKPTLSYYHTVEVALETSDVAPYATITAALAAISAAYTPAADKRFAVYIHPGTYAEALTLLDYVDLIGKGDRGDVVISQAGGTVLTAGAIHCNLKNIKVSETDGVCLDITAAGTISCEDCEFDSSVDAITMADGTLNLENCVVADGDIELSAAGCTLNMYYSRMEGGATGAINAAGVDLVHHLKLIQCDLNGGDVNSTATGATDMTMSGCSHVGTVTNTSAEAGDFTIRDSDVEDVVTAGVGGGDITVYGGDVDDCSSIATGIILWQLNTYEMKVIGSMRIQDAIDAITGGGQTIHVGPGSWTEALLFDSDDDVVTLIGEGRDKTTVTMAASNVVTVQNCGDVCIERLTIALTGGAGNSAVVVDGLAAGLTRLFLRDVVVTAYGTLATPNNGIWTTLTAGTAAVNLVNVEVSASNTEAGASTTRAVYLTGQAISSLRECDLFAQDTNGTAQVLAIDDTQVSTKRCSYEASGATDEAVNLTSSGSSILRSFDDSFIAGTINKGADGVMTCKEDVNMWVVHNGMEIADALASAATTGDTIRLMQGTWAESLVVTKSINFIGEGLEESIISSGDDINPILQIGNAAPAVVACTLQGITVQNTGTQEAIELISGDDTTTLVARECFIDGGSAAVALATAGAGVKTFEAFECTLNAGTTCIDVDCNAAAADIDIHNCEFTAGVVANLTGENHHFDAWDCEMGGGGITVAANVPPIVLVRCNGVGFIDSKTNTLAIEHCTVGDVTTTTGGVTIEHSTVAILSSANATVDVYNSYVAEAQPTDGTQTYYDCEIALIDSNGGAVVAHGGDILAVDATVTGTIVWWEGAHILKVMANMEIMHAANVAASGDTILIGPGTFTEALILNDSAHHACTYKGFSRDRTIITAATGNTVLVDGIINVIFEDLTIELTAATDGDCGVKLDGSTTHTTNVTLRNVTVDVTGVAASTVYGILAIDNGTRIANVEAYNCYIEADTGGVASYAVAANTCTTPESNFKLYNTILNGETYDVYDDDILIELHQCELNGAGVYVADSVDAEVVAYNKEPFATATPVNFAGAANGVFADLGGCELWNCLATVDLYEWVYVDAADNVLEADADGADTHPSIGVVVWKPGGDPGTTAYVKKHGYLYKPTGGWTAGKIEYLSATVGEETETRPANAVVQILGVAKNGECMLVDVALTDAGLAAMVKWLSIPIAWGAGTAPTGTHIDGSSRRAVAIAVAGQSVFSQAVEMPQDFLTFSKLYARLFPTVPTLTAMQGAHAYDDDGAFVDETIPANNPAANDMNLFPLASGLNPAENDAYHFGAARRFSQLDLNLGTPGVGTWTITWEYSLGGDTWGALTIINDGTTGFTAAPAGVKTVTFVVPTDWATDTVNLVLGYYIRARISAVTTPITTRPLGTQSWTNDGTFDWTAYSSAASADEDEATHSDTDTANNIPATEDLIIDLDISGAADFYTMVQKDTLSVELIIDALLNTTQILVLDFRLEYIASH